MKKFLILIATLSPFFGWAQIKKVTVGGIVIESLNQDLKWSQDFRLTLNLNLKKTNHHLILKKNTIQTSNAIEFPWGEPYIFASKALDSQSFYLGFGLQKGVPAQFGSVIFFAEFGTSFPATSLSIGIAIHPQLVLSQRKKSP